MLRKLVSPAWAMLEYGWYPLLLFIATPWFLHQLGTELYGHWMLLTATVSFGGVLNAGTGAATIKEVSSGIGRGADGDAGRIVNVSLAIAILGGGLLALVVFLVFWFAGPILLSRMGDPELVRLTGIAAAAAIWLEQIDNVFSSAMKGAEHFGQAARVEIASKTAQVLTAALVLFASPALLALYLTLLFVAVLRLSLKIVITQRLLGIVRLRPSLTDAVGFLRFAKWGWLQGLGGVMFSTADRMLIGSMLGATSLTYYSIASQLAMQIHAVSAAGLSVIFPKVSRMLEHGGRFSLWRVAKLTITANFLLSTFLALMLYLVGPTILQVWIGAGRGHPTAQLLPWLTIAYWILSLNVVFYFILLGMGRIRFIGITILISGSVAVIAMYIAISRWGLAGSPMGRGVYAVLSLALVWPLVRHFAQRAEGIFKTPPIGATTNNERLP